MGSDEEDRKCKRPPRVDDKTDFKELKCNVGMIFQTVKKFKEIVVRFSLTKGYNLRFSILDSARNKI